MAGSEKPRSASSAEEETETSFEADFIEQAEYLQESDFAVLSADHPDEESIVRRLSVGGAKLLVGPRGCGKTTLMLKAYYHVLRDPISPTLPVYVNFKLSLKLEPLYVNTPNATYWFRQWLVLKVYEGIRQAEKEAKRFQIPRGTPSTGTIAAALRMLEAGRLEGVGDETAFTIEGLAENVSKILGGSDLVRCVILMDDAAHAFSPRQQEDFFEFFRQIKSKEISPKAAIYPGITTYSPTFHVGHDAEQIDVWVRPDRMAYVPFMRSLAEKRFRGSLPASLAATPNALEFLAYASFGIPRSFLNMLRTLYQSADSVLQSGSLDRRKVLDVAKQSREFAHLIYESLATKLPAYREFVGTGNKFYQQTVAAVKTFNQNKSLDNQATEFGLKRPVSNELQKVLSFFQYAGLVMPTGENSRGVKGVFDLYMIHFGDLITENAIVGHRAKALDAFVHAFSAQTHQAWPRISPEAFLSRDKYPSLFRLTLPNCQKCGAERPNEHARFCQQCGAQLKTASLYDELTNQDINVLPLSKRMVMRIKRHSVIRTIKDVLIDSTKTELRSIPYIGPVRATKIASYAEEYVA